MFYNNNLDKNDSDSSSGSSVAAEAFGSSKSEKDYGADE